MPKKLLFNKYSLLELGNLEEQTPAGVKRMLTRIWWYFVRSEGLDLQEYDYLFFLHCTVVVKNENSPIWIWESWSNITGIQPALCSDGSRCDEVESGYVYRKKNGEESGKAFVFGLACAAPLSCLPTNHYCHAADPVGDNPQNYSRKRCNPEIPSIICSWHWFLVWIQQGFCV